MRTRGAHHVSLVVRDLQRARSFYGDLLELPEIERPDFGFPGAWYKAGAIQLHLIVAPPGVDTGSPPQRATPIAAHLALEIEDYGSALERLRAAELEVIALGEAAGQLFVRDPDANLIELIRPGGRLGRPPAGS